MKKQFVRLICKKGDESRFSRWESGDTYVGQKIGDGSILVFFFHTQPTIFERSEVERTFFVSSLIDEENYRALENCLETTEKHLTLCENQLTKQITVERVFVNRKKKAVAIKFSDGDTVSVKAGVARFSLSIGVLFCLAKKFLGSTTNVLSVLTMAREEGRR